MTDEEALDRFQRGLQDAVRIQVMTRFPMTTDDAMRLALAYESSTQQIYNSIQVSQSFHHMNPQQQQQQQQQYYPRQRQMLEYLRSSGVAPMDLDAIHARRQGSNWRPSYRGGNNWRGKILIRPRI